MTNYNFTGTKISKELNKETIQNGGLETIVMPVIRCDVGEHKTEFGGYKSLIHYNKFREEQNKINKENKRLRSLNRQIKTIGRRNTYDEFPSYDLHLDSPKRLKS